MPAFRDISIQRKLMIIMTVTTGVTLVLACLVFVAYDLSRLRHELVQKTSSLAEVVGNTSLGALDFDDRKAATEALAALRGDSDVLEGVIFDKQGNVFAAYYRNNRQPASPPVLKPAGYEFVRDQFQLYRAITQDGEAAGTIYIACSLDEFTHRLIRYTGIVLLVLVSALVVAMVLSNWLQRLISQPILHLEQVIGLVATKGNYALRAAKTGNDELGRLIDGFNAMLGQIQERDHALASARNNLECRVEERTGELSKSLSLLNATLEASTDAVVALDRAGAITCYNRKFIDLWRFPAELVARLDKEEMLAFAAKQTRDADAFMVEIRRTGKNPEREAVAVIELQDGRVIERLTRPLYVGNQCGGMVVTLRDVTARRRALTDLAISEQRFRSVWERSIEGMRLTDREGNTVAVNNAFCSLVRMPRENLVGKPFSIVYAGHGPNDDMDVYRRRFDEGTIKPRLEARVRLWNSEEVDIEVSSCFIESTPGKMVLSLFRDVTERKRTERELKEAQAELLQISRQAGMAEVATSVLHNVGNVLNSVNTSTSIVADQVRGIKVESLERVVETLEQHQTDLAAFLTAGRRSEQLLALMKSFARHIASGRTRTLAELVELARNVDHIKQIVTRQQSYARVSGVTEKVKVTDLVEDALRMNEGGLDQLGIRLERQYPADVLEITVDKHKVLQILINLVRNAQHACDDSKQTDKQIRIQVSGSGERVRIDIIDNGIGIPAENLTRIFSHGFTTRKTGHGFGLHSGALTARELGGSLTVHSDGPDRGATFTLELPIHHRK